jgi:cytochrome P450
MIADLAVSRTFRDGPPHEAFDRLRLSVQANARDILDGLAGEVDLVTAVAAELPPRVLADLFGMPREDRHLIFEWSNALVGADNPSALQHADDAIAALAGMMTYGQAMADDRRADPRGPHVCLGAHLARRETAEMLRHLLAWAPDLRVGEPVRVASNFINGIARLPVTAGAA